VASVDAGARRGIGLVCRSGRRWGKGCWIGVVIEGEVVGAEVGGVVFEIGLEVVGEVEVEIIAADVGIVVVVDVVDMETAHAAGLDMRVVVGVRAEAVGSVVGGIAGAVRTEAEASVVVGVAVIIPAAWV